MSNTDIYDMNRLPNEVLHMILSHLSYQHLYSVTRVSKLWCYLIQYIRKIPLSFVIYKESHQIKQLDLHSLTEKNIFNMDIDNCSGINQLTLLADNIFLILFQITEQQGNYYHNKGIMQMVNLNENLIQTMECPENHSFEEFYVSQDRKFIAAICRDCQPNEETRSIYHFVYNKMIIYNSLTTNIIKQMEIPSKCRCVSNTTHIADKFILIDSNLLNRHKVYYFDFQTMNLINIQISDNYFIDTASLSDSGGFLENGNKIFIYSSFGKLFIIDITDVNLGLVDLTNDPSTKYKLSIYKPPDYKYYYISTDVLVTSVFFKFSLSGHFFPFINFSGKNHILDINSRTKICEIDTGITFLVHLNENKSELKHIKQYIKNIAKQIEKLKTQISFPLTQDFLDVLWYLHLPKSEILFTSQFIFIISETRDALFVIDKYSNHIVRYVTTKNHIQYLICY